MKAPVSSATGSNLSTERIAAVSRQQMPKIESSADQNTPAFQASSFRREVPLPKNADFVEIDGKKYFLDAPRGTYLNIVV
ncbi:MAG: hypothetical protein IJ752_08785 [Alphaproteobacteria bacterium]|nr:hypothetical protein [Alphaproteobacteria bacterium]